MATAQILPLPPRPPGAPTGRAFAASVSSLSRDAREEAIFQQIAAGNVPAFMRNLVPITVTATSHTLVYYVIPDYLAVGPDEDYFLMPMSPLLAQRIADTTRCSLPTKKMVDQIYQAASLKLAPKPIPPSAAMITIPVFAQHNDSVWQQRQPVLGQFPLGTLVGGDKKDVIISNSIYTNLKPTVPKPVVIYGWHQLNGVPIQPVYNGHEETYADYSHGIRLVQRALTLDGSPADIVAILKDPALCGLISDEGTIAVPRYGSPVGILPKPLSFGVLQSSPTSLQIVWELRPATQYYAYTSTNGLVFPDSQAISGGTATISSLQTDSICYVRLRAFSGDSTSLPSEVLAAVPSTTLHTILIVNGFDRAITGNTYNFIRQHGMAIHAYGSPFSSATNDAVLSGLVPLSGFNTADYILGAESTADETFSTAEQESVSVFLSQGGSLFVSGTEIGWDIDFKGSTADQTFFHQYLKARYVADNPSSGPGTDYAVTSIPGGIFDGMPAIQFDNGTHGTYNVQYPDVVTGNDGGLNCLQYLNDLSGYAGVTFTGVFPQGTAQGKLVYLGFPFETIVGDSVRAELMRRILEFFSSSTGAAESRTHIPEKFGLSQNYPNPFNPSTTIRIDVPTSSRVTLKVFDILGREVTTLLDEVVAAGSHDVTFSAASLPSGVYFYRIVAGSYTESKKFVVLK